MVFNEKLPGSGDDLSMSVLSDYYFSVHLMGVTECNSRIETPNFEGLFQIPNMTRGAWHLVSSVHALI